MTSLIHNSLPSRFLAWKLFLQDCTSLNDVVNRSENFMLLDDIFYLIPFSNIDLGSKKRIDLLTKWRDEKQFASTSLSDTATLNTEEWLKEFILGNKQTVMFWVTDNDLNLFGHIGVDLAKGKQFIIRNSLKDDVDIKGVFSKAQEMLEIIIHQEFNAKEAFLELLESDLKAIESYKALKYSVVKVEELSWKNSHEGDAPVLGAPAEEKLITMKKLLVNLVEIPKKILTAGPSISSREIVYVNKAVSLGWNVNHSDYIKLFEEKFAQTVGSKYAMATSSCTGALHLSLLALGIGPGDEVIVPDITWVATASAVAYVGAKPVFADVDQFTWNITVDSIERVLTKKTKAIIPVHLYGFGAPMFEIMSFAKSKDLFIVEDAAPAIGAEINSKVAGTFGQFGCYSFQGAKLLVTGEGGMLVSDDEDLMKKAWKIQDHGRKPGTFWIEELGYKYKMNNVTAALGLAQIERVNVQIEKKREINRLYKELLGGTNRLAFQEEILGTRSICWMTSIQFTEKSGLDISLLSKYLADNGVDTRPVFPTIHSYPMWRIELDNPVSNYISKNSINLPSGVALTRESITKISELILKWIEINEK